MFDEKTFDYKALLITIIIVIVFFIIIFVNYQQYLLKQEINTSFVRIKNVFEQAQNSSLWGEKYNGQVPAGYGVVINKKVNEITLFADLNENMIFDDEIEIVFQETIDNAIEIKSAFDTITIFMEKYKKVDGFCLNQDCKQPEKKELFELVSLENHFFSKKVIMNFQTGKLSYE